MTHKNLLKILFVEDLLSDVDLAVLELRKEKLKFEHTTVCTRVDLLMALKEFKPNLIISDYMMPSYNGMQALKDAHEFDPSVPFILCTGSMNEETAVECLKAGADDYIIKEHLTRLPFAVKEALEQNMIEKEKKAAELLLKENEEKLQSIFRAAPVGIGLIVNRVFIEVNDTFCKMTGYDRKELIGKSAEMIYPTREEYEFVGLERDRQITKNGIGSVETRLKCKNGRILNIISGSTLMDACDLAKGLTFTVLDITDRKIAEEELRSSLSILNASLESTADGILIFDSEGKIIRWNRKFSDMWRIPDEVLDKHDDNAAINHILSQLIDPDYFITVVRDLYSHPEKSSFDQLDFIDGRVFERYSQPQWLDERINGRVWSFRDITETRDHENELRKLTRAVEQNPVSIIITNLDGNIEYVNPRGCEITGYSKDELLGKNPRILSSGEMSKGEYKVLWNMITSGKEWKGEFHNKKKNGELYWERASISSIKNTKDEITHFLGVKEDITEQKSIEETLRRSEEKYRRIFENVQDLYYETSMEGTILEISPSIEILSKGQYQRDDLLGKSIYNFYYDTNERATLKSKIKERGIVSDFEISLKNKDGSHVQCSVSSKICLDAQGRPEKIIGSVHDITDSKQAEDKLRSSEERLKILFDYAPDAYYLSDLKGNFIDGNIASQKLMGYNKNELIGKSFLKLNLLSLKQLPRASKLLAKNALGQATGPDEFVLNRKDRSKVTVEIITHPVKIKDKTLVLGLARDISERKRAEKALQESEEKFRSIMENSADAIFITDQQGKYLYVNKAVTAMLGFTSEEVQSKTIIDLSPPGKKDEYFEIFKKVLTEGKIFTEIELLRKDGSFISTDLNSVLLPGGLVYGSCRDITERKYIQEELLKHHDHLEELVNERTEELGKAKKEAEEANKAKSEFLANMSHEIRTPMNAILGYTELLSSTPVDLTQKNYINSIKSSGRSLLTLINDILDLSKIEAGKLDMEYDYVDTYSFFTEFERIFSLKVSEKGLKFILDITSGTPAGIYIDEARMRQIVFNLIGNAIKFTSEGKIVLKVFTENPQIVNYSKEKSEELIDLIIEVQDTGIGISKELQEAIFEPFVQGRDNKHHGGTGLGLTITRRLIALMDGTIHVQSKPGKGSIFTARIPEIAYLRDFSKTTVDIQIDPSEIVFEKASILIVDDVEHNRSYLRDALKNTRLKIVEAEDGITAYKLIKEIVPDLIIADILMPKMDGFRLLDKIKTDKKLKHIPVIAYSASVLKGQKERIHNSKFAGLLIKPVKIAELYLELMRFLPYKSTKATESDKPLSEVDLIGEITNLPGLIHSLETDFYTTWKTFAVRQPIGEIHDFGKNLIQSGLDHNSSIITGYGKELTSAADSFNIEAILKLIGKYKGIIESLKNSAKNPNND